MELCNGSLMRSSVTVNRECSVARSTIKLFTSDFENALTFTTSYIDNRTQVYEHHPKIKISHSPTSIQPQISCLTTLPT